MFPADLLHPLFQNNIDYSTFFAKFLSLTLDSLHHLSSNAASQQGKLDHLVLHKFLLQLYVDVVQVVDQSAFEVVSLLIWGFEDPTEFVDWNRWLFVWVSAWDVQSWVLRLHVRVECRIRLINFGAVRAWVQNSAFFLSFNSARSLPFLLLGKIDSVWRGFFTLASHFIYHRAPIIISSFNYKRDRFVFLCFE